MSSHTTSTTDPGGSADEFSDRIPEPLPRSRLWLVDGYNAIHAGALRGLPTGDRSVSSGVPWWSSAARERLVTFAGCFPDPDAEIWLVFDGPHPAQEPERGENPSVRVEFAPSADDWIVKRVRRAENPQAIAVVTGDRQVGGRVRHAGAEVVSPRLFLVHCGLVTGSAPQIGEPEEERPNNSSPRPPPERAGE